MNKMQNKEQLYSLRGVFKGKKYEEVSHDMRYLQSFLTKLLRNGGSGFIWRA